MSNAFLLKVNRVLSKSPRYIVERIAHELHTQADRFLIPIRLARISAATLARAAGHSQTDDWWNALAARPHMAEKLMSLTDIDRLCLGDADTILADARKVLAREVDLLGSGPIRLDQPIDWHKDYKTGYRWEPAYCRDIEYNNLDRPSDVKFPWELSRMQWLIPAAQAWLLTGDNRFAAEVREVIEDWIEANPYAYSVNWACTMDVALRAVTWTFLFHALHRSPAWADSTFRQRFLVSLYLHGDFISRHLEKSDINGNHYTADAAGLVFVGLFFGGSEAHALSGPAQWHLLGWNILLDEMPHQVFKDGVDFEASVPYHRLVQELFLLPALYRLKLGLDVPSAYSQLLVAMANFTEAYSRPDGSVPLWGDADDARTLPFRWKPINDHRYLIGLTGLVFDQPELINAFSGPRSEILWTLGPTAAARLCDRPGRSEPTASTAFRDGGFFVLRNDLDHVFVDCGPLGLGGRGGHGHNDLLSFEAVLDGVHLVSDCGAYLYTANAKERNFFRSTNAHNTPKIDGEEINRFVRPDYLWSFHNDAEHKIEYFESSTIRDMLVTRHNGYCRLASPVWIERRFELIHERHRLVVRDSFSGTGDHAFEIPIHFAPGVQATLVGQRVCLALGQRQFVLAIAEADEWELTLESARVSPTYGISVDTTRAVIRRSGTPVSLTVSIEPADTAST